MGEVIIADNAMTGAGVIMAQRLEQLAESGGVVIQGAVYERLPFSFKHLGE
jgi:class 3 adenylate cyclase